MAVHDPRIVERWRTLIADWRTSGLSVAAFCRFRPVNQSGFHRWRNILTELDHPSTTTSPPPGLSPPAPSFVPLRVIPDSIVEVILPSGLQLRVPLAADGFALYLRRLEKGTFAFPTAPTHELAITTTQLAMILGGVELTKTRTRTRFQQPT